MSENRLRFSSDSNYVSELQGADHTDLTNFLSKSKEATLECLLRESLSQLSHSLKQNSTILASFSENNKTQHLNQPIQSPKLEFVANSSTDVTQVPQYQATFVEAFTKSLEQRNNANLQMKLWCSTMCLKLQMVGTVKTTLNMY